MDIARPPAHAVEILRHYVYNPRSVDTLEGIAEWRLLEELARRRFQEIDHAVHWLVESGFLEKIERSVDPSLYRLKAENREDAERFLEQSEEPGNRT